MGSGCYRRESFFAEAIEQWKQFPGAELADGTIVTEPVELRNAKTILSILRTYPGYTYTSLMREDMEFIRLIAIESMGRQEENTDGG